MSERTSSTDEGTTRPATKRDLKSRRFFWFRIAALALGSFLGLVVLEFALRAHERLSRLGTMRSHDGYSISDPELGIRPAPNTPGHDENGFRNLVVPTQADVVCVGDSQTWGVNVLTPGTWPVRLASLTGVRVYAMAVGGYGPCQYEVLARRALKLRPKTIVVAVYLGNDLYDAYRDVHVNALREDLRGPSPLPELTNDTIAESSASEVRACHEFLQSYSSGTIRGVPNWLRGHSAIGRRLDKSGLWPGATRGFFTDAYVAYAQLHPESCSVWLVGPNPTCFLPKYRLCGLNLEDPRIAEGLRITRLELAATQGLCAEAEVRLIVVLWPTKESSYARLVSGQAIPATFTRLVSMEARVRENLLQNLQAEGIAFIDALGPFQDAIGRGECLFPSDDEGHPAAPGYDLIARLVRDRLATIGD